MIFEKSLLVENLKEMTYKLQLVVINRDNAEQGKARGNTLNIDVCFSIFIGKHDPMITKYLKDIFSNKLVLKEKLKLKIYQHCL